jgi:serine/threonine protein kinase/tetratricopeptide (TPR) repeat protein
MRNESKNKVEPIFNAACERARGAERKAYLDGACGEDAELRARVDVLLVAHDKAGEFLREPAVTSQREGPGSTIDAYKLLQEIGEGGMGVVYMAEQERPVRRKVALKVIKLGMDTKQVIARFEAERQALAMMDHANIARVLDAGATATGRPYFVMELVRGVPIDEYCDTHTLETSARLRLFVDVCRAVQHAHQKGIIHRDLKPTNVLITSYDGIPVPKIIDFGVAKATNQKLTERTLFTEFHQVIGTPEYMSPEQAEMSGLDVDTRSDIYSLGVLLYQLLTGSTPANPRDLRTAAYAEMTRMIREDEPQTPSTRISKLGVGGDTVAKHRSSDSRSLSRRLQGDLDWIVMKALEKDRTRRYDTASAFAADVARHLENQPVEAGPPGAWYRLSKFAHRNQKTVAASLVLVIVVGLGLFGTSVGFVSARAEADRSGRISEALQDVLATTGGDGAEGREELERVLVMVRETFGADRATYATVLDTLVIRLRDAGDFEAAADLCRESLEVWREHEGVGHPNVAVTLARLGSILHAQGDSELAEQSLRESLALFGDATSSPGLEGLDGRLKLADLLTNQGEYAEADELLGEALSMLRASAAPSHWRIITTLEARYVVQINLSTANAGETIREIYSEVNGFYPDDSPLLGVTALSLGRHLARHGDPEGGEPYLREALARFKAGSKPSGFMQFAAYDSLFQIVRSRTDTASVIETDDLLRELILIGSNFLGAVELATNQKYYASRMFERERYGDAIQAMMDAHQSLVVGERSLAERENLRDNLAKVAFEVALLPGLQQEVLDLALEAAEIALSGEPNHPAMQVAVGASHYRLGNYALAAKLLDAARPLEDVRGGLSMLLSPSDHAFRAMAHAQLGNDELAKSEFEALRVAHSTQDAGSEAADLLLEAEALIHPTSSSSEDD